MSPSRWAHAFCAFVALFAVSCSRDDAPRPPSPVGSARQSIIVSNLPDASGKTNASANVTLAETFTAPENDYTELTDISFNAGDNSYPAKIYVVEWDDENQIPLTTGEGLGSPDFSAGGFSGIGFHPGTPYHLLPGHRYAVIYSMVEAVGPYGETASPNNPPNLTLAASTGDTFPDGDLFSTNPVAQVEGIVPNDPRTWWGSFHPYARSWDLGFGITLKRPSALVVSQSKNPTVYGEPFSISAHATSADGKTLVPGGNIRFSYFGTPDNTDSFLADPAKGTVLKEATTSYSTPLVGTTNASQSFDGTADWAQAFAQGTHTVDYATSQLALAKDKAQANSGDTVTFTATVAAVAPSTAPATGTVTFTDSAAGGPSQTVAIVLGKATWSTNALALGDHTIAATYNPAPGTFLGASDTTTVKIGKTPTTLVLSDDQSTTTVGGTATFHATIAPALTGNAQLTITNTPSNITQSVAFANGVATLSTTALSPGAHTVHATFAGDGTFAAATASDIQHTVDPDAVKITVAPTPPTSSTYPSAVSFDITVASAGTGGTPSGNFRVFDGGSQIASGALEADGTTGLFNLASVGGGAHHLEFDYDGDAKHVGATTTFVHTINVATSTLTLTDSGNSPYGQAFTLEANVATVPGGAAPTGAITFLEGGVVLGGGTAPTATLSADDLSVGAHTISVQYAGNANYKALSGSAVHTVVKASTNTKVLSLTNPSTVGAPVNLTVMVAPAGASIATPTGSVTVFEGTVSKGTGTLDKSGNVTIAVNGLAVGPHALHAVYAGDGNYVTSTSADLGQTVGRNATTITLTSSKSPSSFGESVTFFANVPNANGKPATGAITFIDSASGALGSADISNGFAVLATSALATGTHTITASYGGDANFLSGSASLAQVVDKAATKIVFAVAPATAVFGQSTKLTATVTGSASGTVTFHEGGVTVGTAALLGGVASITKADWPVGTHALSASVAADANHLGSSATAQLVVTQAATAITVTSSSNPAHAGTAVSFTAVASALSPGAGTPTGTITFRDGATVLGNVTVGAGGVATLTTSTLAEGSHVITAEIAASASFLGKTSVALTQTISPAATTLVLTASPTHVTFGTDVQLTVTATSTLPITGTVDVVEGNTVLCTVTLDANGSGTCTSSALHAGTHGLSATLGSATAGASVIVDKAATTTNLASSTNPAKAGDAITFTATVSAGATGSVEVFNGTTSLGTVNLDNGSAVLTTDKIPAGSFDLTAKYSGDADHAESTSVVLTQVVNAATDADAGTDAGTDSGASSSSSSSSSGGSSSSSSGSALPPPTADAGGSSGGLGAIPIANPDADDDSCSTTAPGTGGSAAFGIVLALAGVALRRRRRAA